MKFLQVTLLLCFQFVFAQNSESLKEYFIKNSDNNNYHLCNYDEAQKQKLLIVNKLDKETCIVYIDNPNKNNYIQLNNKWKLHQIKKSTNNKTYTVLTIEDKKVIDQLIHDKIDFEIKKRNCLLVKCSYNYLRKLIQLNEVYTILEESQNITLESKIRDQNFTINNINKVLKKSPNLTGSLTKIGLKDTNINPDDIDLINKINFTNQGENSTTHGTDMATIICGSGNSGIQGKGVANQAKIQFSNTSDLYAENINPNDFQTQNHSYGTIIEDFYGSLAQSYDENIRISSFNTHIFSIGNEGSRGFKTITGNFKQAKNIITVGAVDQNESINIFSSKGPAYDGRIKPELVAYSETGTSNATAIVSGISSLLQEYYKTKNNQLLKNTTLKAILINSAKDLGNKGPDYTYGYGNVDAYKSLETIENNNIIESDILQNETKTFQITIPQNSKKAKFTLVWDDLPSTPGSTFALINNLEFIIKDENNNEYLPYILDPKNPEIEATKGLENLNNIKQIELENLQAGYYTIQIRGKEITENNQYFSIAYLIEPQNLFEWNYPAENDNFPYDGKTISPFKWHTNISDQTGQLSISFDDGTTWEQLNDAINLNTSQFRYTPNTKNCSIAKLKMTINNTDFISPSFIISYDLNLNTTLACNNMTEITWDNYNSSNGYKIYEIKNNEMSYKETINQNHYSYPGYNIHTVAPIIDSIEGIKSESTLQTEPDSKCYFEFVRSEIANQNIQITTSLFSLLNISKIELYKIEKNRKSILKTIERGFEKLFLIDDLNPNLGDNYYQIKITLNDGKIYESDIVNSFFVGNNDYLVYPTIIKSDPMNITTKDELALPVSLIIYNTSGQLIKNKKLTSINDNIDLNDLQSGIYFYRIVSQRKKENESIGKLVKL
jgi:hypothetical protein